MSTLATFLTKDGRRAFACNREIISMAITKFRVHAWNAGAYRQEKLADMTMSRLRMFLRQEIKNRGWNATGSLGRDTATKRYLEYAGFRDVAIRPDGASFECSVRLFGFKMDREAVPLPYFLQVFLGQEVMAGRGGLTNQAVLSLWDSAKILYSHWFHEHHPNAIEAEEIMAGAITAEKIDAGSILLDPSHTIQSEGASASSIT